RPAPRGRSLHWLEFGSRRARSLPRSLPTPCGWRRYLARGLLLPNRRTLLPLRILGPPDRLRANRRGRGLNYPDCESLDNPLRHTKRGAEEEEGEARDRSSP